MNEKRVISNIIWTVDVSKASNLYCDLSQTLLKILKPFEGSQTVNTDI